MQVSLIELLKKGMENLCSGSYNKINGSFACENGGIMNDIMKDELGFKGYMMSDWNGIIKPKGLLCGSPLILRQLSILRPAAPMQVST